jgi:hypothetical protein
MREQILTPVGRLVQGSLYEPQTTDPENNPLTIKSGPQAGQPRTIYYFAIAIPKGPEKHWAETVWGQKIWAVGHAGFPNGQANSPSFAWKIIDGDSQTPNRKGKKPCEKEGYPQHWVLNFSSGFAPTIVNETGSAYILEKDAVNAGDYIQIAGTVDDNGSTQQPGVFLNHSHVAFVRYGKRITQGVDPKNIGFGVGTVIPAGASLTPVSVEFTPLVNVTPSHAPLAYVPPTPQLAYAAPIPAVQPIVSPSPYTQILSPPAAPAKVMTASAQASYDDYIKAGWTDAQLIQHGLLLA